MKALRTSSTLALTGLGLAFVASPAQADHLHTFTIASYGYAVSGDGQWATLGTGSASGGSDVFLWSARDPDTLTNLGGLAGNAGRIVISDDGSVIGATTRDANGHYASSIYKTSTGLWTPVPALGGVGTGNSVANTWTISADGRYVGGSSYVAGSYTSHGWLTDTQTGTVIDMGTTQARVQGIGPGAQVLIGQTTSAQSGAMWTRNADGSYALTTLQDPNAPGNTLNSAAALSNNGLWAAGNSFNGITAMPYRVNTQTGEVQFFDKIGTDSGVGKITASVGSISADGNTIVGIESPQGATLPGSFGFIWQADGTFDSVTHKLGGTTMSFDDFLTGKGIDLDNHYTFLSIIGMSADGTVFNGIAMDNDTLGPVSFVVTVPVPEPSQTLLMLGGLAALASVIRRRPAQP